eukprot:TRINITY_DN23053_c0_g1_i1.p1 TRINITY_DN23053_c0_g1~~TRINITY_DN23053_c0_g1_i1.p1  ORF type:complete len:587 (-),score=91.47 TRINITY_DN23053_c0_g1_i1:297-2057(-)
MPLDRSRIQGFGSEEPSSSSFWGSSEVKADKRKCPAGHELVLWEAKPGWCDGCGSKIKTGQPVMDCRKCNYYLCKSCAPQDGAGEEEGSSFWGGWGLGEAVSGPAANSALDEVALRFGDVIDAAGQDFSDMAADFKSFMASAVGLDEEEEEESDAQQRQAAAMKTNLEKVSPRSRQECQRLIEDFCHKYPAARVRPNSVELEKLWVGCSVLKATALVSALYDQLRFSNGDTSWQPRLRILYALDCFYRKGGPGREVALGVFFQAKGIIQHLVDVQQCAEKAFEVTQLMTGKIKVEEVADSTSTAQAESSAKVEKKETALDLLDMSELAPTTTPATAPPAVATAAGTADLDLLGGSVAAALAPALPQDTDLLGQSAAPASASSQPRTVAASADAFDPNAKPATNLSLFGGPPAFGNATGFGGNQGMQGMGLGLLGAPGAGQGLGSSPTSSGSLGSSSMNLMSSTPMSMGSTPMNLIGSTPIASMASAPMGMASAPMGTALIGGAPYASLGGSASGGYASAGAASGTARGSLAGRPKPSLGIVASASNGSAYGAPYIPDQLTPSSATAPEDPFAFVTDLTGLGQTPSK